MDAAEVQAFADVANVARSNGVTASRVRHWAAGRELVALRVAGRLRFPPFQFDRAGRVLPGMRKVTPHLPDEWSWKSYRSFLTLDNPDLQVDGAPVSPLAWLSMGSDPAAVIPLMGNNW